MNEKVRIVYGETVIMEWDGTQASAPILANGHDTGYQTADARHRTEEAVRLVAARTWGPVYETTEDAVNDCRTPSDAVVIWDALEYETIDNEDEGESKPNRGAR